jgi:hypothetical protein
VAAPRIGDHWHAAYGVHLCGEWQPDLIDGPEGDVSGIHSHGDGLIHIHPFSSRVTGEGANLGAFGDTVELELSDDSLKLPDRAALEDGADCGGTPGVVQVRVWENIDDAEGRLLEGDFADHAPQDGEIITIAFLPEGEEVPRPPSAGATPTDLETTPTAPGEEDTPTTSTPEDEGEGEDGESTTTTAPAEEGTTTTTAAPAG